MHDGDMSVRMAAFRKSFGLMAHKDTTPQYYFWKSRENPFGRGEIHLIERGTDVAGSGSVTPKRVAVAGKIVTAFEIGDTYTNPNFRRQGIFLEAVTHCTDFAISHGGRFIYGIPNEASLAGYEKKANYQQIPGLRICLMTKHVSRRILESRIASRIGKGPLSRCLASVLMIKNRAIKRMLLAESSRPVEVSDAAGIDAKDGLWGDRSNYSFFTVRDSAYLAWRYFANPDKYRILQSSSADGQTGFVVIKCYLHGAESVGSICDIVTTDDNRVTARTLLRAGEDVLIEDGCDYIQAWCCSRSPYFSLLRCLGYAERNSFPVIVFRDSELASELLHSKGPWHFMYGDSDNM